MDSLVVILAYFFLLFRAPATNWLFEIAAGVLAADHKPDLTGGVGRNSGIRIFDVREDLFAISLELGDQR